MGRTLLHASWLGLFLAVMWASTARCEEQVRIAVGRFQSALTVKSSQMTVTSLGTPLVTKVSKVHLRPHARGILVDKKLVESDLLEVTGPGDLGLRGHQYHQHLEIRWRKYQGKPELLVVHPVSLERYITGVVASELPRTWSYEALKAQAIAARSYAIWQKYRRLDLPYHLQSSVLDQVYGGKEREHPDAVRAVKESRGQVMTFGMRPIEAYFYSACGDHTESAKEGWGNSKAYLPGVQCGYCRSAPRHHWSAKVDRKKLERWYGGKISSITISSRSKMGRALKVTIDGHKRKTVSGHDLRRAVGYTTLWSTWISHIKVQGSHIEFAGKGAGHGVGMCQWGAHGMAKKGKSAEQILHHYYPGIKIRRMY